MKANTLKQPVFTKSTEYQLRDVSDILCKKDLFTNYIFVTNSWEILLLVFNMHFQSF